MDLDACREIRDRGSGGVMKGAVARGVPFASATERPEQTATESERHRRSAFEHGSLPRFFFPW